MKKNNTFHTQFGPLVLFGSGETSPSGQRIFDRIFQQLPENPKISLLETPAGFELNSFQVTNRIADFLRHRLQNYRPHIEVIPARKRGTSYSPDSAEIAAPLLKSDLIFAGPGSPSYAVRQLKDSLTWHYLLARHRLGAALAFSSAAVIALGNQALPVYEIYKVGEDPHWKSGLDFFAPYDLSLVFIPHWNNNDGGDELDTSHCFMGQARFDALLEMLPKDQIVVGIDEHTALWVDCAGHCCEVLGLGTITIVQNGEPRVIPSGESFPLNDLRACQIPEPSAGIPPEIWEAALQANCEETTDDLTVPKQVQELVDQRQSARGQKDWAAADELRDQIEALGWVVKDTPDGPEVNRL